MILKEFLELNKNGLLLDVCIYDKNGEYVMCEEKRFYLNHNIFLDQKVLSFAIDIGDIDIELDVVLDF